jgi:competence protein ComGC
MHGKHGFTQKEILILVAIIVAIAAIAIPSFVKARNKGEQNTCINNLRIIDAGKYAYSMTYRLTDGDIAVTASVNEYTKGCTTPKCPAGGRYTYENVGSLPECSVRTPASHILPPAGTRVQEIVLP